MAKRVIGKGDLVSEVAELTGSTKKSTQETIGAFLNAVQSHLVAGEKVNLVNFGTFEVKETKERLGRHPQTQESLVIPASKRVAFKAYKGLSTAVKSK